MRDTRTASPSPLAYWREAASLTATSLRQAFTTQPMANVAAGITVALVALPLNMALAIACGLPASVGLVTGAVAGLLGAVLGGSRLQITGPEVALAPITLEIILQHGVEGLLFVTLLAGLFQIALGVMRIGRLVHVIPVPVIGGFLAAVGIMVFDSQLPVLLGVSSEARLVTELTPEILRDTSGTAVAIGVVVVAIMVGLPRLVRRAPAPLVALAVAMAVVAGLGASVPMVSPIEGGWPAPALPGPGALPLTELVPEAIALALIASIDSLLCAVSVDARTAGPRTRTDQELVAQGLANIGSACFGGMPVAAAVVRSAAAVEAGASTRLAAMVQSLILALVVVAFSGFVGHIPLVALASILLVIGWRLIDWGQLRLLWNTARFEVVVFGATSAGILLTDFVLGVGIGVVVALADFAYRQRSLVSTRQHVWSSSGPEAHPGGEGAAALPGDVRVVRLEGPLFFGSQAKLDALIDEIERSHRHEPVVIDLAAVPTLDASGASALARAAERLVRLEVEVWLCSLGPDAKGLLEPVLVGSEQIHFSDGVLAALRVAARRVGARVPANDHSDGRWRSFIDAVAAEDAGCTAHHHEGTNQMNGAIAKDDEMSTAPASVRRRGREVEAETDVERAWGTFALANTVALLLAIVAAVLLHRATTLSELSTPAAVCLGLAMGLVVTARLSLRKALTDEARRKGLGPEQTQAFVRHHLARYGEGRTTSEWG